MAEEKEVVYDPDGYDQVTDALRALIAQYPGLEKGESFCFSTAPSGAGKAIFPTTGAVIQSEVESITGHVTQMCLYPFTVLFRASGLSQKNRVNAKEWLDTFGRWLEKQTVTINGKYYVLNEYPALRAAWEYDNMNNREVFDDEYFGDGAVQGIRKIVNIVRQTPAYLNSVSDDKSEDWVISMVVTYRNEFDR